MANITSENFHYLGNYRVFLKILTHLFSVLRYLIYIKAHVRCTRQKKGFWKFV